MHFTPRHVVGEDAEHRRFELSESGNGSLIVSNVTGSLKQHIVQLVSSSDVNGDRFARFQPLSNLRIAPICKVGKLECSHDLRANGSEIAFVLPVTIVIQTTLLLQNV